MLRFCVQTAFYSSFFSKSTSLTRPLIASSVAVRTMSGGHVTACEVRKSENDPREYRHLTLANNMQVLLVSDPEADKVNFIASMGRILKTCVSNTGGPASSFPELHHVCR
jgi:hypothetical protein